MVQYILLAMILAACVSYAAIRIYRTWQKARHCNDFHCSGCPFYDKCSQEHKKRV